MREDVQNAVREIIRTMPDLVTSAAFGGSTHDAILGQETLTLNEFGEGETSIPEAMRIILIAVDPPPYKFDPIQLGGKPRIITSSTMDAISATVEIGVSPVLSATVSLLGKRFEEANTRSTSDCLPALILKGSAFTSGRSTIASRSSNEWLIAMRISDFSDHIPVQIGDEITLTTRLKEAVTVRVSKIEPVGAALILTARGA